MTEARSNGVGSLARLWQWLKDQWIREVPEDLALCEFDCRKAQCFEGEWDTCQRRLSYASGELMPGTPHSGLRSKP
ncbi:MAG: hypothetical protein WCE53_13805 [Candidatus Acidiferrum sp.]